MLLVTCEIVRAPAAPELLGASIDLPRSGTSWNASALTLAGWAVGRNRKALEVTIRSTGRTVHRVRLAEQRPDVEAHLSGASGALDSGFLTTVDVSDTSRASLEIAAVLEGGAEIALGEIRLRHRWWFGTHPSERGVVSIIIPCFNQGHFLGEAIESCFSQSYGHLEVVVVDDGSTDNTQEVASRYPRVRYVRQDNGGLAAARNTGIRRSNGEYLMFLDADDRLVAGAVAANVELLEACETCAFVSGDHCYIGVDGQRMIDWTREPVRKAHYEELLRTNYIGCPAAVTYRRAVLRLVGGFEARFKPCEDYELNLRIARQFPVQSHGGLVAEYRRYAGSMSGDPLAMLRAARSALRSQRPWADSAVRRAAIRQGLRFWAGYYGPEAAALIRQDLTTPSRRLSGLSRLMVLARFAPRRLPGIVRRGSR